MSQPSLPALRVLLALAEQLNDRPGWTSAGALAARLGADATGLWTRLSDLGELGYCELSAHGPFVYVTPAGAALARSTRAAGGEERSG